MPTITFLDDSLQAYADSSAWWPTGRQHLVFYVKEDDGEVVVPFTRKSVRTIYTIVNEEKVLGRTGFGIETIWTIEYPDDVVAVTVDERGNIPHTADTATWEAVVAAFRGLDTRLALMREESIELFVRSHLPMIAILCDAAKVSAPAVTRASVIEKEIARQKKKAGINA